MICPICLKEMFCDARIRNYTYFDCHCSLTCHIHLGTIFCYSFQGKEYSPDEFKIILKLKAFL